MVVFGSLYMVTPPYIPNKQMTHPTGRNTHCDPPRRTLSEFTKIFSVPFPLLHVEKFCKVTTRQIMIFIDLLPLPLLT